MNVSTKEYPREVKQWLAKTEQVTGASKRVIITAVLMDHVEKARENKQPTPPKKSA